MMAMGITLQIGGIVGKRYSNIKAKSVPDVKLMCQKGTIIATIIALFPKEEHMNFIIWLYFVSLAIN